MRAQVWRWAEGGHRMRGLGRRAARLVGLALLAAALASSQGQAWAQESPAAEPTGPAAVLEQLEAALNARDLDRAMALFGPDAHLHEGTERVSRPELRRWLRERTGGDVHVHLGGYQVDGEQVTWTAEIGQGDWWRSGDAAYRVNGSATVRNGQIVRLSTGSVLGLGSSATNAAATPSALAGASGWTWAGAALAAVTAGLLLARRRVAGGRPAATTTGGRLIAGLGAWLSAGRTPPAADDLM